MTMYRAWLLFAVFAALAALAFGAAPAGANGVPQLVKLTYLDGISNTGKVDAEGVLEFSFAEAYAKVTADGLEAPPSGKSYQGWLVKSGTNQVINVGVLTIEDTGLARLDAALPNVTDYTYDFFIITLEDSVSVVEKPGEAKTIGGFFSVINPQTTGTPGPDTGSATPVPGGTERPAGNQETPRTLPNPGDADSASAMTRALLLLALIVISTSLSVRYGRAQRRSHRS